jgi:hypothetical protein
MYSQTGWRNRGTSKVSRSTAASANNTHDSKYKLNNALTAATIPASSIPRLTDQSVVVSKRITKPRKMIYEKDRQTIVCRSG